MFSELSGHEQTVREQTVVSGWSFTFRRFCYNQGGVFLPDFFLADAVAASPSEPDKCAVLTGLSAWLLRPDLTAMHSQLNIETRRTRPLAAVRAPTARGLVFMNLSLRKADFLLFFIFAAAALISAFSFPRSAEGKAMVRIISNGEEFGTYPLDKNAEIEIVREGHRNVVIIQDGIVHMDYSNCKNQICVHTGEISDKGEIIVCLPNYVIVEIIGNGEGGEDDEAIDAIVK